jgi:hypothetical protein
MIVLKLNNNLSLYHLFHINLQITSVNLLPTSVILQITCVNLHPTSVNLEFTSMENVQHVIVPIVIQPIS